MASVDDSTVALPTGAKITKYQWYVDESANNKADVIINQDTAQNYWTGYDTEQLILQSFSGNKSVYCVVTVQGTDGATTTIKSNTVQVSN